MSRLSAYAAYALGSTIFLLLALLRGQPWYAAGSALFLLGTLLLLVPAVRTVGRRRQDDAARRA